MAEVPVGAVVYQGASVIAEAHNRRELDRDPTAHAELIAVRNAARALGSWRLLGCRLAVTLEPCPMCASAVVLSRLDRLVFGASDPKMGAVRSLYAIPADERLNHRPEIVEGLEAEACGELLRAFFRARR